MSKRKGVSLDEKRTRMLDIFYEKKEFYQLKELEKIAPKEKGIVAQSVKDVLQALVDDGYVESEKIGTSTYFWAFPSKATQLKKRKLGELDEKIAEAGEEAKTLKEKIETAKASRDDSDDRDEVLSVLMKLKAEKASLLKELELYRDSDPDVIKKERKEIQIGLSAANEWTDNIFAIRSWARNKFNMEEEGFNKSFDIPENLDNIELPK